MQYGIITKKGRFTFEDICFGRMSNLPMSSASTHGSVHHRMTEEDVRRGRTLTNLRGEDFVAIDFPLIVNTLDLWRSGEIKDFNKEDVVEEVLNVIKELPMYKDLWLYQPMYNTLRVKCDAPYDQVITLLFIARNLLMKNNSRLYIILRDRGYSRRVALLVSHLFYCNKSFRSSTFYLCTMRVDEYNLVNPQTLTKSDFIRFLKQEEGEQVWRGCNWNSGEFGGYKRDRTFEEEEVIFREELIDNETWDDDDEYDEDCGNNGEYYKLVDAFSTLDSEFIPPFSFQENYRDGGFVIPPGNSPDIDTLCAELDTLLSENNIK